MSENLRKILEIARYLVLGFFKIKKVFFFSFSNIVKIFVILFSFSTEISYLILLKSPYFYVFFDYY